MKAIWTRKTGNEMYKLKSNWNNYDSLLYTMKNEVIDYFYFKRGNHLWICDINRYPTLALVYLQYSNYHSFHRDSASAASLLGHCDVFIFFSFWCVRFVFYYDKGNSFLFPTSFTAQWWIKRKYFMNESVHNKRNLYKCASALSFKIWKRIEMRT